MDMGQWRIPAGLAGLLALACAGGASPVPRTNTTPEGSDTYFYGPLDVSDRTVVDQPQSSPRQVARAPRERSSATATAREAQGAKNPKPKQATSPQSESKTWPTDWLGERRGYDRVELKVPGLPQADAQEDDNALLKVELADDREADGPVLQFAVVDSGDGTTALCEIQGVMTSPTEATIAAEQPCFTKMLGVPLDATTRPGQATMSEGVITVRFEVVMLVPMPDGQTVEGSLKYLFKG